MTTAQIHARLEVIKDKLAPFRPIPWADRSDDQRAAVEALSLEDGDLRRTLFNQCDASPAGHQWAQFQNLGRCYNRLRCVCGKTWDVDSSD